MAQNGRVKGHELSSSYKKKKKKKETTPKSQLTIEPLNSDHQKKKNLEPTEKEDDTLYLKTEKKPQKDGRRGTLTIKSNPIPTMWVA